MEYGFIKVASAVPSVKVGDVRFNTQQIESIIVQAEGMGVEIIVFRNFPLRDILARISFTSNCSWMLRRIL